MALDCVLRGWKAGERWFGRVWRVKWAKVATAGAHVVAAGGFNAAGVRLRMRAELLDPSSWSVRLLVGPLGEGVTNAEFFRVGRERVARSIWEWRYP